MKPTGILPIIAALILLTGCERWATSDNLVAKDIEGARIVIRIVSYTDYQPQRCRARVTNIGEAIIRIRRIRYGSRGAENTADLFRLDPGMSRRFDESDYPCQNSFYVLTDQGNEIGFWDPRAELRQMIRDLSTPR